MLRRCTRCDGRHSKCRCCTGPRSSTVTGRLQAVLSELVAQVEIPGLTADAATLLLAGMSSGWLLQVTPQVLPQALPAVFYVVCVLGASLLCLSYMC